MARKRNLASVLKADLATNMPMNMLAELVRSQGRGRDTILAHITPREAAKLKREGGRGSTNPSTGLPEFEDDFFAAPDVAGGGYSGAFDAGAAAAPAAFAGGGDYVAQNFPAPQQYTPGYDWAAIDKGPVTFPGDVVPMPQARPAEAPQFAAPPATMGYYGPTAEQAGFAGAPTTGAEVGAKAPAAGGGLFGEGGLLAGVSPLKAALAAGGLGMGLYQQSRARQQAKALQDRYNQAAADIRSRAQAQQALAQPLLTQGAQGVGLAAQGALTPAAQQAFDAYRARVAQSISPTGGGGAVMAAQVGAIEERARQMSLDSQMKSSLELFGRGAAEYDRSIANFNNALQQELNGLSANMNIGNAANTAAVNFFTNLAQAFSGPTTKA